MTKGKEATMDTEEHESDLVFTKFVQDLSGELLLLIQQEHVVIVTRPNSLKGNFEIDHVIDTKPNNIH